MVAPIPRKASTRLPLRVLGPTLLMLVLLTLLAVGSICLLGATRAYVGGESQWSKARSAAVQHLRDYIRNGNPHDYTRFESALSVCEGDRRAREAMLAHPPDLRAARAGLVAGNNHPDDVSGMIQLFVWFHDQPLFKDALQAWIEGDLLIAQLRSLANRLHDSDYPADVTQRLALADELDTLNQQLQQQELMFSRTLSRNARYTEAALLWGAVLSSLLLAAGSIAWTRVVVRRQQAHERALVEAHRHWELAAQAAQLGLYRFDLSQGETHFDARAARMHGLSDAPITVRREAIYERMAPEDRQRVRSGVLGATRRGEVFRMRYRMLDLQGQLRHIENVGHVDLSLGEDSDCGVGVVRDVSEEVIQAELASQRDAAQRVALAQRAFLSRLSHELRTPLNAVLGFAQLLLIDHQHPMSAQQRQQVDWILDAGQQLLHLIEDVLDLSKVEAGEISLALAPTEVHAVIAGCLPLVEGVRERAGVTLAHLDADTDVTALVDRQRLQQVLINLLSNACKYNRPGGMVTVGARLDASSPPEVVIEVADTGMGMSPKDIEELFQPFKRLESALCSQIEGTGLGLYIVRLLVQRMNGSVDVISAPGEGSRFVVRLPAASGDASDGALA